LKKIDLYLLGGLIFVRLITLSASTLAATSQPSAVSPERILYHPSTQLKQISPSALQSATTTSRLMAQAASTAASINSVSQLSDVQPSDWAFQALQSLMERYGAIAGYPNATLQGNRALTRYEFAVALNAVIDRVNQLTAAGQEDLVSRDHLRTLQRLQSDFATELLTLRGRVDNLESRTTELETHQFSTTTKLQGQSIFAVSGGSFSGNRVVTPQGAVITNNQPNPALAYRVSLDLNTSFSGQDLLKIRLDSVSDLGRDNVAGYLEPYLGSVFEYSVRGTPNQRLGLDRLYYTFTPSKDLSLSVGPSLNLQDYIDLNSYANGNGLDFSTLALTNNYILFPINGPAAGALVAWNSGGGPFKVRAGYEAGDGANPNPQNQMPVGSVFALANLLYPNLGGHRGLFGSPYEGMVELEYSPSKALAVRLQYSRGNVFNGRFGVFGANFEWTLSPKLGVFGRYGYGSYSDTAFGHLLPNYWMAGISSRDVFVPNAVAGVAVGQPFIERAVGNATQTNIEAFYSFPVNDNIRITPVLQVITQPINQSSNGTIFTGSVRTVFFF